MKPNPKPAPASPPAATPATSKLNLTPKEAKREAAKLREYRDDLETRKRSDETDARSSPLGRTDE